MTQPTSIHLLHLTPRNGRQLQQSFLSLTQRVSLLEKTHLQSQHGPISNLCALL